MPRVVLTLALTLSTITPAPAQTDDHGAGRLNGDWTLDLRPTNNAQAYIKTMKLDITPQGIVRGDFYDHAIEDGRSFDAKGRTCFAFHTSDNSGPTRPRAVALATISRGRAGPRDGISC